MRYSSFYRVCILHTTLHEESEGRNVGAKGCMFPVLCSTLAV